MRPFYFIKIGGAVMSFTGAINSDMRSIVASLVPLWQGRDVYIACSGNFTIENILSSFGGYRSIHSNDVSLYTSAIGGYLTGRNVEITVADLPEYEWLNDWVTPGLDTIATLMLCTKVFPCLGRKEPYYQRMFQAYMRRWPELHEATKEKNKPILESIKIDSYFPGDAFDFIKNAPENAVVITFPPTYAGGYEKLYKKFDEAFIWDRPEYTIFDEGRLAEFFKMCMGRDDFLLSRDVFVDEWEKYLIGQVQTSVRSRPVYMYSGEKEKTFLTYPSQKSENVPLNRLGENDDIVSPLRLVPLMQGQFNTLRSQYLSVHIAPASASVRLAVLSGDKLIGAIAFDAGKYDIDEAYMMTDFAIAPTKYKRLSKLVLAAALSKEVQGLLMQSFNQHVNKIFTTAFTSNAVSMKYRGLFEVYNRKEDAVNYEADAGKWSLEEGLLWWMKKHGKTKE